MKNTKVRMFLKAVCLILVIALASPVSASAATEDTAAPMASTFLKGYQCELVTKGGGRVDFSFYVKGDSVLDRIGVLSIEVYESVNNVDWYSVKTYSSGTYTSMLTSNASSHSSSVSYYGISGRYYKAYVRAWGSDDGIGESQYFWTSVVKAN